MKLIGGRRTLPRPPPPWCLPDILWDFCEVEVRVSRE
jgi:hypothetical protein